MKKLIIISQCSLFLFLVSYRAGAQNNSAPVANPEAKVINAEEALKATAKNATVSDIKTPVVKPMALPLQVVEAPKQEMPVEPMKPGTIGQKLVDVRPSPYKWAEPKSIDRPNTPTTSGFKSGDPINLPVKQKE